MGTRLSTLNDFPSQWVTPELTKKGQDSKTLGSEKILWIPPLVNVLFQVNFRFLFVCFFLSFRSLLTFSSQNINRAETENRGNSLISVKFQKIHTKFIKEYDTRKVTSLVLNKWTRHLTVLGLLENLLIPFRTMHSYRVGHPQIGDNHKSRGIGESYGKGY